MRKYTIGQIAEMLNVSPYTLRYYDKEGLLPFVKRDKGGRRYFDDNDIELFHVIDCLKKTSMPIKEIGDFIKLYMKGDKELGKRRAVFEKQKAFVEGQLKELQEISNYLTYVCWFMKKAEEAGTAAIKYAIKEKDVPKEIRCYKKKFDELHLNKQKEEARK